MELMHDMKTLEHRLVQYEHNFMHLAGKIFHHELFWVIVMIAAIVAVITVLAYFTQGEFVERPMHMTPFGLY